MYESQHGHSHRIRRSIGSGGIILSLVIFLGVIFYAYNPQTNSSTKNTHSPTSVAGGTPSALRAVSTCKTPEHQPGDISESLSSGGLQRTFLVHLAPSYGIQPQPLVINYHGFTQTMARIAQYSNMGAEADKAGFIVVFPQGVDNPSSWNAGIGLNGQTTGSADDVQFTRDLLSYLKKNYCVDAHRIYLTGYSVGGGMAYRVACNLSTQIAAIATVAGAFYHAPGGCNPSRPLPILEIHGQADPYAPYYGDPGSGKAAVSVYLNVWLNFDQCNSTNKVIFQQGDVTGVEWSHCTQGTVVEHYKISDGGHVWPGAAPEPSLGYTTHVIDANVVMWDFLSHFSV